MRALCFFLLPMALLSGCRSTGVIPVGKDMYMIGKKDGTPGLGVSLQNKAEVYAEAAQFCKKRGMEVMTVDVVVVPAAPAQLGSTELQFKCVPPAVLEKKEVASTGVDDFLRLNEMSSPALNDLITSRLSPKQSKM